MTHSWKEEPEQKDLDSLDGWAKSNNINCVGINANIFPEVLKATCMHAGRGPAPRSRAHHNKPLGSQLTLTQKIPVAAKKRDKLFGSINRNVLCSLVLHWCYASKSPQSL